MERKCPNIDKIIIKTIINYIIKTKNQIINTIKHRYKIIKSIYTICRF